MVKYYGRARTRTGSVNTNQLGLKMSGCPSTVGKQGRIARYMGRRVDCMMGLCKPIRYHEVIWPRTRMRNQPPFCQAHATKCLAAAGGVGTNHNIPYYRIPAAGESGCTPAAVEHYHGVLVAGKTPLLSDPDATGFISTALAPEGYTPAGTLTPPSYEGMGIWGVGTVGADNVFIVWTTGTSLTPPYTSITVSGDLTLGHSFTVLASDGSATSLSTDSGKDNLMVRFSTDPTLGTGEPGPDF